MIPVEIDVPRLIADLNRKGWCDYKISIMCGLSKNYIAMIKAGELNHAEMKYQRKARLLNFWESECSNLAAISASLPAP